MENQNNQTPDVQVQQINQEPTKKKKGKVKILAVLAIIVVIIIAVISATSNSGNDNSTKNSASTANSKQYSSGSYKVGTDIAAGEFILFADDTFGGYFSVNKDANGEDIIYNGNFNYNSIITISDGQYLELVSCYAVPFSKNPKVKTNGEGMFKIGLHLDAGEYKLETTNDSGYYCVYDSSTQENIITNDNFDNQTYVSVSDGQYLELVGCKIVK